MMDYPCAKFGNFSLSRFGFIVRTDTKTDRQAESQTESQTRINAILTRNTNKSSTRCQISVTSPHRSCCCCHSRRRRESPTERDGSICNAASPERLASDLCSSANERATTHPLPTSFAAPAPSPDVVSYVVFEFSVRMLFWLAPSPASRGFSVEFQYTRTAVDALQTDGLN